MSKLRIAFVSAVRHAGPYADILELDRRVEVVGMGEEADVEQWIIDDGRSVAEAHGITWHEDLGDWLSPDHVDLAIICSEPTRHARLAIEVMERGIDVLVDKPVATTLADADAVADAAARTGRRCTVINRTHAPALRRLRSWVDAGHLGLPLHLDAEFIASGKFFATSVERPELVVDPSLSGGGEMLNFLGYCVDAISYTTGLEVVDVHALASTLFSDLHREQGVEDVAVLSLGLENGVTATVTVGRVPFAPGLGPTSSSLRVLGSHGHAIADDDRPRLERYGAAGLAAESFDGGQTALENFLDHVVTSVLSGGNPDYGIDDARATMAVIDAAMRSLDTGEPQAPLQRP